MTEMPSETPITHELYQPAQIAHSPPTQDIDPRTHSFLAVFKWLHLLESQHLRVEAGLEDHRATFTSTNWNSIPTFANVLDIYPDCPVPSTDQFPE